MAKHKQPKSNNLKATEAKPEPLQKIESPKKQEDSITAFYFRSLLLAVVFFFICWFTIVNNYVDMAEWDGILRKNQAKQTLNSEETKKLMQGDRYRKSAEFKWFYNYKWIYHNLLNKNLVIQASLDTMDMSGRQLYKNKLDYRYISMIAEKTPKDAVILMPDQSDLVIPENFPAETPQFTLMADKAWCYYFLYPRTLVYEDADSKDSLDSKPNYRKDPDFAEKRKKVTHVAIMYGRGYEHLSYTPEGTREAYTVLPIKK